MALKNTGNSNLPPPPPPNLELKRLSKRRKRNIVLFDMLKELEHVRHLDVSTGEMSPG